MSPEWQKIQIVDPAKKALSDWTAPWKVLISQFFWGKTDKVSCALFTLSSV